MHAPAVRQRLALTDWRVRKPLWLNCHRCEALPAAHLVANGPGVSGALGAVVHAAGPTGSRAVCCEMIFPEERERLKSPRLEIESIAPLPPESWSVIVWSELERTSSVAFAGGWGTTSSIGCLHGCFGGAALPVKSVQGVLESQEDDGTSPL